VRLPTRFTFTTNLVLINGWSLSQLYWGTHGIGFGSSRLFLRLHSFPTFPCGHLHHPTPLLAREVVKFAQTQPNNDAIMHGTRPD
jgi:hypothetical protein